MWISAPVGYSCARLPDPHRRLKPRVRCVTGVHRPAGQHTHGSVHGVSDVPDAAGRPLPDGGGAAAGHGGERGVQERAVAVRADAARRGGLHTVRQLPSAGHRAAAGRGPDAVLGDAVGRVPQTGRRPPPPAPPSPRPRARPPRTPVQRAIVRRQRCRRRERRRRGHAVVPTSPLRAGHDAVATAPAGQRRRERRRSAFQIVQAPPMRPGLRVHAAADHDRHQRGQRPPRAVQALAR